MQERQKPEETGKEVQGYTVTFVAVKRPKPIESFRLNDDMREMARKAAKEPKPHFYVIIGYEAAGIVRLYVDNEMVVQCYNIDVAAIMNEIKEDTFKANPRVFIKRSSTYDKNYILHILACMPMDIRNKIEQKFEFYADFKSVKYWLEDFRYYSSALSSEAIELIGDPEKRRIHELKMMTMHFINPFIKTYHDRLVDMSLMTNEERENIDQESIGMDIASIHVDDVAKIVDERDVVEITRFINIGLADKYDKITEIFVDRSQEAIRQVVAETVGYLKRARS